jgi:putative ABC transport system permease protein
VDSTDLRVIGVMPPEFQFPERAAQFWAPLSVNRFWHDESAGLFSPTRSLGFYRRWNIVARLNELPDRAPARGRVQARLSTIAQRLEAADPRRHAGLRLHALPLRVQPERSATRALLVLFGAVCFVLLIACTNLANLLLARGKARERELALRSALGAERGQLIRQLLMESLILALAGAVAGLLIGAAGLRALVSFGPPDLPRLEQARIDGWIVTFTCGVSVLSAALFGLAPAWALSRRDPAEALRSGGRGGGGAGLRGMRQALVVTELALALLLLTGAGLLMRSLLEIKSVDPGYRPERVLTLQIGLPSTAPPARRAELVTQALGRLTALPGVEAAGTVNGLFELGGATSLGLRDVEGHEPEPRSRWTPLTWKTVGGEYFKAMQIALLRGRTFDVRDGAGAPLVAVIDESTARRYWPGENPIGKRFKGQDRRGESDEWLTVIGLVRDTRRQGLDRTPAPTIYQWSRQSGDATPDLVVRTSGDVRATAATVRATIRAIDASAIVSAVTLLEAELGRQLAPRRFQTWLLGAFSMLAMVLAMVRLYGVIHFMVAQRTREIGIRIALGADPRRVLGTVLGEGARLAAIGIGAGTLGAWWLTALLADLLFGVRPGDPLTFAVSAAALMAVALAACAVPAVRAMRVNPVVALRDDR